VAPQKQHGGGAESESREAVRASLRATIVVAPASRLHVRPAACAHARCGLQADEELHPGPSAANSALHSAGDERSAHFSLSPLHSLLHIGLRRFAADYNTCSKR